MNPFVYSALNVKQDFRQKRLDDQYSLHLSELNNQKALKKQQDEQAALAVFQQYIKAAGDSMKDLLPQDAKRVNEKYKSLMNPILEDLKSHNVDPDSFMMSGGHTILEGMAQGLQNSKELKSGMINKKNAIQAATEYAEGKIWRPVTVTLNDGTQKQTTFDDALQLHDKGEIKDLPYNGAYENPKYDPIKFAQTERPIGEPKSGKVSMGAAYNTIGLANGMNPQDFQDYASKKGLVDPNNPNETVFSWKAPKQQKMSEWEARLKYPSLFTDKDLTWVADQTYKLATGETNTMRTRTITKDGKTVIEDVPYNNVFKGYAFPVMKEVTLTDGTKERRPKQEILDGITTIDGKQYPVFQYQIDEKGGVSNNDVKKNGSIEGGFYRGFIVPLLQTNNKATSLQDIEKITDYIKGNPELYNKLNVGGTQQTK